MNVTASANEQPRSTLTSMSDPYQEAFDDVCLKESIRLIVLNFQLDKCPQCNGTGYANNGDIDRPCPSCYPNLK